MHSGLLGGQLNSSVLMVNLYLIALIETTPLNLNYLKNQFDAGFIPSFLISCIFIVLLIFFDQQIFYIMFIVFTKCLLFYFQILLFINLSF